MPGRVKLFHHQMFINTFYGLLSEKQHKRVFYRCFGVMKNTGDNAMAVYWFSLHEDEMRLPGTCYGHHI